MFIKYKFRNIKRIVDCDVKVNEVFILDKILIRYFYIFMKNKMECFNIFV